MVTLPVPGPIFNTLGLLSLPTTFIFFTILTAFLFSLSRMSLSLPILAYVYFSSASLAISKFSSEYSSLPPLLSLLSNNLAVAGFYLLPLICDGGLGFTFYYYRATLVCS